VTILSRNKKLKKVLAEPFSRENYSGEHWIRLFFLYQTSGTWHTVDEIKRHLAENYRELSHGTILNILSNLKGQRFIESERGIPTLYRLLDASGNPSNPIGVSRRQIRLRRPLVLKIDLVKYLKTLPYEDVRRIHDIRLWSSITGVDFVDGNWHHNERQRMFWRNEMVEGKYRFNLKVYEKAGVLDVAVACANTPFAKDERGLSHLNDMLWIVWSRFLNSSSVPYPSRWTITQWHCGRDAKKSIDGLSFETTWTDFYGNLIRVYTRDGFNGKVRVERIESPDDFVETLLGYPANSIKKISGEPTCVEVVLSAVQMKFAVKMSMESDASNVIMRTCFP
jgi:hypothetical protein